MAHRPRGRIGTAVLLALAAARLLQPSAVWAGATPAAHVVASFESAEELAAVMPGSQRVQVTLAHGHASHGERSARVSFPPYDPQGRHWPSVRLGLGQTASAVADWSAYRRVELDVFNPSDVQREIGVSFTDQDDRSAGYSYWKAGASTWKTVSFDLSALARGIDCSRMQGILLWQRLHVRRPAERTVFFVDQVRLIPKALDEHAVAISLLEPHFRGAVYESHPPRRLRAVVRLDLPPGAEAAKAAAALVGPDDTSIAQHPLQLTAAEQTVAFPAPRLSPGRRLRLRVSLADNAGHPLLQATRDIPVLPAATDEVLVDAQNRLLVNGRPFFPIGLYNVQPEELGMLAQMGFNCAGPYLVATPEYVAEAKKHGMRLISNGRRGQDQLAPNAAESATILAHYMYDEPQPESAPELRSACLEKAAADLYHPTCGCNNLHHEHYTDVADIMMVDAYPMPGEFDVIVDRMTAAVGAMKGRRPVWYIPQAFARLGYAHAGATIERSREPTYDELRAATWLGIALGARGVVFYSCRIQTFTIRHGFPDLWRALGHTVAELRALHDVLLWPSAEVKSSDKDVHAAAMKLGDRVFVIAVNAARRPAEATFTLAGPAPTGLHVLGEDRTVACVRGEWRDAFGPQTAHLYASWPVRSPVDVGAARRELDERRRARERRQERNVALFYRGASVAASWGFPKNVRGWPWQRMIDGYRGTTWPLGARGLLPRSYRFPRAMRAPDRWIEVRLARAHALDRAVVVTSHRGYELAVLVDGSWRAFSPVSEERTDAHGPSALVRAFDLQGAESQRVRLLLPRPPSKGEREVYFEVEVYRREP